MGFGFGKESIFENFSRSYLDLVKNQESPFHLSKFIYEFLGIAGSAFILSRDHSISRDDYTGLV
jgi:hypothetical protein